MKTAKEHLESQEWYLADSITQNGHQYFRKSLIIKTMRQFAEQYHKDQVKKMPIKKAFLRGSCPKCDSSNYGLSTKSPLLPKYTCWNCDFKFDQIFVKGCNEEVDVIVFNDLKYILSEEANNGD